MHQLDAARRHRRPAAARRRRRSTSPRTPGRRPRALEDARARASPRRERRPRAAQGRPRAARARLGRGARRRARTATRRELRRAGRGGRRERPAPRLAGREAPALEGARARRRSSSCAHRETLEMLRAALSQRAQLATARLPRGALPRRGATSRSRSSGCPTGPSLLVSTECGGEGRNFEFCHRLVLFDLPWNPVVVEQRIGRLDRIGRTLPVEIVYFRPPGGLGADVVRAVRGASASSASRWPGLERELARRRRRRSRRPPLEPERPLAADAVRGAASTRRAPRATRIREAAYHELHRDPLPAGAGATAILARVPADLDALNEDVVVAACERLGFHVERAARPAHASRSSSATRRSSTACRACPAGRASSAPSTARRRSRTRRSTSSPPAIRWSRACSRTSRRRRAGASPCSSSRPGPSAGWASLALYKDGPAFDVVAVDASGRSRPEWAEAARRRPPGTRWRPQELPEGWADTVRAMVDGAAGRAASGRAGGRRGHARALTGRQAGRAFSRSRISVSSTASGVGGAGGGGAAAILAAKLANGSTIRK